MNNALYASSIFLILIEWIDRMIKSRIINSSLGESSVRKIAAYTDDVVVLISARFRTTISSLM